MLRNLVRVFAASLALLVLGSGTIAQENRDETKVEKRFTAEVKDGKVIIRDEQGNEQEIEIDSGQGHVVISGLKSDGEQKDAKWKAVVIDENGEQKVIELDADHGNAIFVPELKQGQGRIIISSDDGRTMELDMPEMDNGGRLFSFGDVAAGKYMIGVSCGEVPAALRAHVDLADGVGLLVESVVDQNPASAAGIHAHDILVQVDGDDLTSVKQLVEAVQAAGEADRSMNISLLRSGARQTVEVTPTQRKDLDFQFEEMPEGADPEIRQRVQQALEKMRSEGRGGLRLENFGPGVVEGLPGLRSRADGDLREQIEELKKQVEELRKAIREQQQDK